MQEPITLGGVTVEPGEVRIFDIPFARLYTHSELNLPVQVINSRHPGPRLFISAALHGDEINGVEIIRRLISLNLASKIKGTLILIPVANVFGFINHSRYLPDRRDLNRSFPGSAKGSLTSRLAHLISHEIISQCSYGIDLHTGASNHFNLPQIRACLDNPETRKMALAFGAPVIMNSGLREGSLREMVRSKGKTIILYEGGEALRFDRMAVLFGVRGCLSVMRHLGMLPKKKQRSRLTPVVTKKSSWVRAPESGIMTCKAKLGRKISKGEVMAHIADPFGQNSVEVHNPESGIIVGMTTIPLVNKGDALFHVAQFHAHSEVKKAIEQHASNLL